MVTAKSRSCWRKWLYNKIQPVELVICGPFLETNEPTAGQSVLCSPDDRRSRGQRSEMVEVKDVVMYCAFSSFNEKWCQSKTYQHLHHSYIQCIDFFLHGAPCFPLGQNRHGPNAKTDNPKGDANWQMYDNEIHTEWRICLLHKCQWTTFQQQLLPRHDDSIIKPDKGLDTPPQYRRTVCKRTTWNLTEFCCVLYPAETFWRRSKEMEGEAGGRERRYHLSDWDAEQRGRTSW